MSVEEDILNSRLVSIMAGEVRQNVRECGLALKKTDNRPENLSVTPELALARRMVKRDRVEDGRLRLDPPHYTPDEALELMAYHLSMAAAFYQLTPNDSDVVRNETYRIVKSEPAQLGALVFLNELDRYYEELRREQDAEEKA